MGRIYAPAGPVGLHGARPVHAMKTDRGTTSGEREIADTVVALVAALRTTATLVATCITLAGCLAPALSSLATVATGTEPPSMLPTAPGSFGTIAWVDATTLVLSYDPHPTTPGALTQLWSMGTNGTALTALPLAATDSCPGQRDGDPHASPDGRFTFERQCLQRGPTILYAAGLGDSGLRELARLNVQPLAVSNVSWAPGLGRAIGSAGDLLCEGLVWISGDAMQSVTATVSDNGTAYSLGAGATSSNCDA